MTKQFTKEKAAEGLQLRDGKGDRMVTYCKSIYNNGTCEWISMGNVYKQVVSDTYRAATEKARKVVEEKQKYKEDKEYDRQKRTLPCVVFPSLMDKEKGRSADNILAYTGMTVTDIDGLTAEQVAEVERKLRKLHCVLFFSKSISGRGFHIVTPYTGVKVENEDQYKKVFGEINGFYREYLGVDYDKAACDGSRAFYLNWDSDAYYNPNAEPFGVDFSRQKANISTCKKVFDKVNRYIPFQEGQRNPHVCRAGYLLNEYGVPLEMAFTQMAAYYDTYPEWKSVIENCYKNRQEKFNSRRILTKAEQAAKKRSDNESPVTKTRNYLSSHFEFRRNTRMCDYEFRLKGKEEWYRLDEVAGNTMYIDVKERGINISRSDFDALISSSFVEDYDSYKAFFDSLPEWDGVDRLAPFWDRLPTEESKEYRNRFMTKWLVNMVRHMLGMSPNEIIPILTGGQGVGKTKFVRTIVEPFYRDNFYCKTDSNFENKDERIKFCKYAAILVDEGNDFRLSVYNSLKAISSQEHDVIRLPYGRRDQVYPTTASFIITCNSRRPLRDSQNRRFPVLTVNGKVRTYLTDPLSDEDYRQLYAQVLTLAKDSSFKYYVTDEDMKEMEANNEKYRMMSDTEEYIRRFYRVPDCTSDRNCVKCFDSTQIKADMENELGKTLPCSVTAQKIGSVMHEMSFECRNRSGKNYYIVEKLPVTYEMKETENLA